MDVRFSITIRQHKSLHNNHGLSEALDKVENKVTEVTTVGLKPKIVYIQPTEGESKDYADYICFEEFADAIKGRGEIAERFAKSLRCWANVKAGLAPPGAKCP